MKRTIQMRIDNDLLSEIDAAAKHRRQSRTQFFMQAVLRELHPPEPTPPPTTRQTRVEATARRSGSVKPRFKGGAA